MKQLFFVAVSVCKYIVYRVPKNIGSCQNLVSTEGS